MRDVLQTFAPSPPSQGQAGHDTLPQTGREKEAMFKGRAVVLSDLLDSFESVCLGRLFVLWRVLFGFPCQLLLTRGADALHQYPHSKFLRVIAAATASVTSFVARSFLATLMA